MQTITSPDGTEIGYETRGQGRPLVLVHGTTETRDNVSPVVAHLVDDFQAVLVERRGRGESGDTEDYGLDREVADVCAVLANVGDDPALFGQSFGGLCALEAARRSDVSDLVLYEPSILVGEHRRGADVAHRMAELVEAGERREAVAYSMNAMADGGETPAEVVEEALPLADTILRELRAVEAYELDADVDLDARTLLLTGEHGADHLKEATETLDDRLPDSRLVAVPGVGHAFQAQDPESVADEIRSFLSVS